ncbi:MAG TPA: hypothetical protein VMS74_06420 [Acidimicrobiia bacterium]|nr:hypothetical protein [Acidimicrobiia bacterium]
MRRITATIVATVLVAGCSPPDAEESTTSTATTIPPTTTTTIDPLVLASATCNTLKVATFDLDAGITAALDGLAITDESELADAEVGRIVVAGLVSFYDQLAVIAEDAPDEVGAALTEVSDGVDPWREALASADETLDGGLEDLDPSMLRTAELDEAVSVVDEWTVDACGTAIPVDAEEIVFTTIFASMFGAFGSLFGQLGEDVFDPGDILEPDLTAVAFGDDPDLDDLYSRCGNRDGQACRDLYFSAYGEYELWGQTCGASIPLRQAFSVDCQSKFSSSAAAYGDDFVLDSLWDECESGVAGSCDALFAAAPFGSAYEGYGATCAGTRVDGDIGVPCSFLQSGDVFGYGDDATFDLLWDTCSVGDLDACDDLFFQTPLQSAYEAFGRVCGDLIEVGRACENAAAWLGGPVG